MKITRYVYMQTDANDTVETIELFTTLRDATVFSKEKLQEVLHKEGYRIPPEYVDKDGFITYLPAGQKEEITSSEWGWSAFDGVSNTLRGTIERIEVTLTTEEMDQAHQRVEHISLLMDAKYHLFEFLNYQEDPEEGSYWAARDAVVEEYVSKMYGVSVQELIAENSKYYVLEKMVALFEKREDANLDDWSVWEQIVRDVLRELELAFKSPAAEIGRVRFMVSSDDGKTWSEQFLTSAEAVSERNKGHIAVRP